jgi:rubrerythrin
MERSLKNVVELSAGEFDAVRTLRDALAEAERGKIQHVIIIMADDEEGHARDLWCTWSELTRFDILWAARWFNSKINHRYFGMWHNNDD